MSKILFISHGGTYGQTGRRMVFLYTRGPGSWQAAASRRRAFFERPVFAQGAGAARRKLFGIERKEKDRE